MLHGAQRQAAGQPLLHGGQVLQDLGHVLRRAGGALQGDGQGDGRDVGQQDRNGETGAGRIPGRGALCVRFGRKNASLMVMIVHLALSRRGRMSQLDYIGDLVNDYRHVVLMGDMNCRSESDEMELLVNKTLMTEPLHGLHTFPSWRPKRNIDHILVTPTVEVEHAAVLDYPLSDHLPISMEIVLPDSVELN